MNAASIYLTEFIFFINLFIHRILLSAIHYQFQPTQSSLQAALQATQAKTIQIKFQSNPPNEE